MTKDDKPFRIVVSIIRGTNAGRALELMRSGMQCASETLAGAKKIVEDWYDAACVILYSSNLDAGVCFGVIVILDTKHGKVEFTRVLVTHNID